jgi:hypothetical protein
VRAGRVLVSTRGHRFAAPGAPRVVTRGLGGGYADRALDTPARWPVMPGDRLIVVSTELATRLDAAAVAAAVATATGEPARAVLAAGEGHGFVVVIEVS